tara:strand:+ start:1188 stop:3146 length:1959 start_codon:yes stop_codon:yes gene_type:complete
MSITNVPNTRDGSRLINLKTNLKNLTFGGDRPAGGSSNQPYIVKDIPEGTGPLREGMPLLSGPDFILRDGFLAPIKAITDISRLAQMFVDLKSPRGLFFTLKQNLLSKASVKTQASFGAGYFGGAMNQGAYLPIGTLLDAGLGWAGIHLNKNGLNPVGSLGGPSGMNRGIDNPESDARNGVEEGGGTGNAALNLYSAVVKNSQETSLNRLTILQSFVSTGTNNEEITIGDLADPVAKYTYNPGSIKTNTDTPILYSYSGGPGSILGFGKTNIFKHRPTYNAIRNYLNLYTTKPLYNGAGVSQNGTHSNLLIGDQFRNYVDNNRRYLYPRSFGNFVIGIEGGLGIERSDVDDNPEIFSSKIIHLAPDYRKKNKGLRVGLGDPGQAITYNTGDNPNASHNVFNYGVPAWEMEALDKITALKMYEAEGPDHTLPINDFVKFRIAVVNNGADEGKKATYLHFRAYINGFTDSYGATWNDTQYVGRGNTFKNYGGFKRDISMGFTMMATSKAELIPMFAKLNFLASSLAPDYTSSGFMRGNMVRMTVGGYLYEIPGVLTSLTYTIPDDTTWEIAIDANGDSDPSVKELPHRIEVTLAFTPVENFLPSRQRMLYNEEGELRAVGNETFISLSNGRQNNYAGDNGYGSKYRQPIKNSNE